MIYGAHRQAYTFHFASLNRSVVVSRFGFLLQRQNFIALFPVASHCFFFNSFFDVFSFIFINFCTFSFYLFHFAFYITFFCNHSISIISNTWFFFIEFLLQNLCSLTFTVHYNWLCLCGIFIVFVTAAAAAEAIKVKQQNENLHILQFNMDKCMPAAPKMVGREFVKKYYTIMNKSPENLVIWIFFANYFTFTLC